jgi:predicted nucleic acid-binding protein
VAEFVRAVYPVRECRDPKDDKFLEVASHGKAEIILTGDADLPHRLGYSAGDKIAMPRHGLRVLASIAYAIM